MGTVRFHDGELSVQRRAGLEQEAARLEGMLDPPLLDGGASKFLAQREFATITGCDRENRLWTSPLLGKPGFLAASRTTLKVGAAPASGDPLAGLPAGQAVGLLAIDFSIRRRVRVNGTLTVAGHGSLEIAADQAFGNCPSYIQKRYLELDLSSPVTAPGPARRGSELTEEQVEIVENADTFFLGTSHSTRGADTSHKGGLPGFVRVDGPDLWWPDYAGNNLFNSLGNIAVDPVASMLFIDFRKGATLYLSGMAHLEWVTPGSRGDDGGTGRRVRFHALHIAAGTLPVHAAGVAVSPHNPELKN